jgi:hypothetical protein
MSKIRDELMKLHYPCRRGKGCHCEKLIDQAEQSINNTRLTEEEIEKILLNIEMGMETKIVMNKFKDLAHAIYSAQIRL